MTQATTYLAAGDYVASTVVVSGAPTLLTGDRRVPLMQLEATNIIVNDKGSMRGQDEDGGDGSFMGWAKHLVAHIEHKYGTLEQRRKILLVIDGATVHDCLEVLEYLANAKIIAVKEAANLTHWVQLSDHAL